MEAKMTGNGGSMCGIRYARLTFTVQFQNDAVIPAFKGSTLRGGLGDVLLNEHCIGDGNCEHCSFRAACVVPNIYYHPLKILPASVNDGGSLGYTFECPDRRTHVRRGGKMDFSLLLYGDVIVYFSTILDAIYRLGMIGIGQKKQGKFSLIRVTDQDRNVILGNGTVDPRAIHVRDLMEDARQQAQAFLDGETKTAYEAKICRTKTAYEAKICGTKTAYEEERTQEKKRIEQNTEAGRTAIVSAGAGNGCTLRVRFLSPWTQKWRGAFLSEFNMQAFAEAVYRRVYLMHCMEGIEIPARQEFDLSRTQVETIDLCGWTETRYSNHQDAKIRLHGLMGEFQLTQIPEELVPYIFAGQIVHIGKNTSIGFGQYEVER